MQIVFWNIKKPPGNKLDSILMLLCNESMNGIEWKLTDAMACSDASSHITRAEDRHQDRAREP
jgi:hypothetical protein